MASKSVIMEGPPPVDTLDLHFKLVKHSTTFKYANEPPPTYSNLVAVASSFGVAFIGTIEGFIVIKTSSLSQEKILRKDVPLRFRPTHLVVNCNETLLAVGSGASTSGLTYVYDIGSLAQQGSLTVLQEFRLTTSSNVGICDLIWNPAIPSLLSSCLSDGSVVVIELKPTSFEINSLPSNAGARCQCWSPKGKQIVIGGEDGKLTQYKPDLTPAKICPAPPLFDGNVAVVNILWISNFQFAAFYRSRNNTSESPVFVIVNANKNEPITFVNYEDITYGTPGFRCPQFYIIHLSAWNLILIGSANSVDVAVLHLTGTGTWEQWQVGDSSRAELPLSASQDETYPLGMAVDFSSHMQVPWPAGETVLPPMPRLLLLSHENRLSMFDIVNVLKDAAHLCNAPSRVIPDNVFDSPTEEVSATISVQRQDGNQTAGKSSSPLQQPISSTKLSTPPPAALSLFTQPPPAKLVQSLFQTPIAKPSAISQEPQPAKESLAQPVFKPTKSSTENQVKVVTPAPPPEEKVVVAPTLQKESEASDDVLDEAVYDTAINDEINAIAQELSSLMKEISVSNLNLGSEEQFRGPLHRLRNLEEFENEVEETTVSQAEEVSELKLDVLEWLAKAEDARLVAARLNCRSNSQFRRAQKLDPVASRSLRDVLAHRTNIETQLTQIADHLDRQWEEHQMQCRKDAKEHMETPFMDDICKTIDIHRRSIGKLSPTLARLHSEIELHHGLGVSKLNIRQPDSFLGNSELSKLEESIGGMSLRDNTNRKKLDETLKSDNKSDSECGWTVEDLTVLLDCFEEAKVPVVSRAFSYEEREAHKQEVTNRLKETAQKIKERKLADAQKCAPGNKEGAQEEAFQTSQVKSLSKANLGTREVTVQNATNKTLLEKSSTELSPWKSTVVSSSGNTNIFPTSKSVSNSSIGLLPQAKTQDAVNKSTVEASSLPQVPKSVIQSSGSTSAFSLSKTSFGSNVAVFPSNISTGVNSPVTAKDSAPLASSLPFPVQSTTAFVPSYGSKGNNSFGTNTFFESSRMTPKPGPINSSTANVGSKSGFLKSDSSSGGILNKPTLNEADNSTSFNIHTVSSQGEIQVSISNLSPPQTPLNLSASTPPTTTIFPSPTVVTPTTYQLTPIDISPKFSPSAADTKEPLLPLSSSSSTIPSAAATVSPIFHETTRTTSPVSIFRTPLSSTTSSKSASSFSFANMPSGGLFGSSTPTTSQFSKTTTGVAPLTSSSSVFAESELPLNTKSIFGTTSKEAELQVTKLPVIATISSTTSSSDAVLKTDGGNITPPDSPPLVPISSPSTSTVSSGLFEALSLSAPVTTGGLFAPVPLTSVATSGSIFSGSTATAVTSEALPVLSKDLFGELSSKAVPSTAVSSTTNSSVFGSSAESSGIFGTTISSKVDPSVQQSSTSSSSFGSTVTSTTTDTGLFGSGSSISNTLAAPKSTTSSAFGAGSPTSAFSASSSIFGTPSSTTSSGAFVATSTTPGNTSSIFSPASAPNDRIFGAGFGQTSAIDTVNKPVTGFGSDLSSTTNLFGQMLSSSGTPAAPAGNIFSQASPSKSAFETGGSIFGNTTTSTTSSAFGTPGANVFAQATTSLFGTPTTTSTGIFGQPAVTTTSSFFGQAICSPFGSGSAAPNQSPFGSTASATTSPFGGGSSFGNKPAFGQNLFGQSNTTSSIFGGSTVTSPVFGGTSSGSTFQSGGSFSSPGPFSSGSGSVVQSGFDGGSSFSKPAGGFGGAPVFGGSPTSAGFGSPPSFGGSPAFGNSAFGTPQKVFGSPSTQASPGFGQTSGATGFENMANQNSVGFGNLAQMTGSQSFGTPFTPTTNTFGGSSGFGGSSFSSWR